MYMETLQEPPGLVLAPAPLSNTREIPRARVVPQAIAPGWSAILDELDAGIAEAHTHAARACLARVHDDLARFDLRRHSVHFTPDAMVFASGARVDELGFRRTPVLDTLHALARRVAALPEGTRRALAQLAPVPPRH